MTESAFEIFEDISNPLDSVEDILSRHDWIFERPHMDELSVQVSGKRGAYRMTFLWQEEFSVMQFYCEYGDLTLARETMPLAAQALKIINDGLWLGHFAVPEDCGVPSFRHTSLFRGFTQTSGAEHVEDLMDIALSECERYYNVFDLLAREPAVDGKALGLAISDSAGEA